MHLTGFMPLIDTTSLTQKTMEETKDTEKDKTFLITMFHPNFRECNKIVQHNWDILDKSSSTRPLLKLNLVKGSRRVRDLRDILVRARLPKALAPGDNLNPSKLEVVDQCNTPRCKYCSLINKSERKYSQ